MHRDVSSMTSNLGQFEIFWEIFIPEGFAYPVVEFKRRVCPAACPAVSTGLLGLFSFVMGSVVTLMYDINFVSL